MALGFFLALSACSEKRRLDLANTTFSTRNYIDVLPGSRIRVVTPILKSGGTNPALIELESAKDSLAFKTNDDFLGYESDYYVVRAEQAGELSIAFKNGSVRLNNGTVTAARHPRVLLFQLPPGTAFMRLVLLIRTSVNDHNEAILTSRDPTSLDQLTREVEENPKTCGSTALGNCTWIPEGIAVQPERKLKHVWLPE
jgi:hypothetical protein